MTQIVTVNVNTLVASLPDNLQQTGAFISQGATSLTPGTSELLTSEADLTDLLDSPLALTSLAWAGSVVTAVTTAPHGIANGVDFQVTIAGAAPSGYNGTFLATSTGGSGFHYPLASNPGAETVPGTYILADVAELIAMNHTFFSQGTHGVYVLELGPGDAGDGVAALQAYIVANPLDFYSYLVPKSWADEATFITMLAGYNNPTSKQYFFVTASVDNYTDFSALDKCAFLTIPAPAAPSTEFTSAAPFFVTLKYAPSTTNRITPTAFSYVYGVTAYPTKGNLSLLATLKTKGVNTIQTGAEGGLTNTLLAYGTTMDLHDFTFWYSVDYIQINLARALAAEVIRGSNNPLNPLYYNQAGIDRLQAVAAGVMGQAITYGMSVGTVKQVALDGAAFQDALDNEDFLGSSVVNAIPFIPYSVANPLDYPQGKYAGLSAQCTIQRGFIEIVFNLNVTDFVAA